MEHTSVYLAWDFRMQDECGLDAKDVLDHGILWPKNLLACNI